MNHSKITMLLLTLALAACGPEAARMRGGGPGADPGNRDAEVEIHGPTNPGYDTPQLGKAMEQEGRE
jgi:hypothetical protein